jgi:hypothetical protein
MTLQARDYEKERREREKVEALAGFDQWRWAVDSFANYGHGLPLAKRVRVAHTAIRRWRSASGTRGGDYELEDVAARVAAATLADEILAGAGSEQDDATIRWVVAGLRCSAQPFCTGCQRCQTVTSPARPAGPVRQLW